MIEIKRISLSELYSFVNATDYAKDDVIPISWHRAISYIHNPRASQSDVVLYLAYNDNKLVGYRSILPDVFFLNGKPVKVGWLSGNWVSPECRRQGVATKLFEEAMEDWDQNLIFTNFAPKSKAVYDKSKRFVNVFKSIGVRLYLRPCLSILLPAKGIFFQRLKFLWRIADTVLNFVNPFTLCKHFLPLPKGIAFEYVKQPSQQILNLFSDICKSTPSKREANDLRWIMDYPWLVSAPLGDRLGKKYFFSSSPQRFETLLVNVFMDEKQVGFFLINHNGISMSTPYVACPENYHKVFAIAILKHALRLRVSLLTTFNEPIAKHLKGLLPFGFFSRRQHRSYFATRELSQKMGNNIIFNDGDGDCAFV